MAKQTKLAINLSVLLRMVHHTHRGRSRQRPAKDVMGFLEGVVHETKDKREIEILNCHPAIAEEFMEKPFSREVFMKGKKLCSALDRAQKKGGGGKGVSEPSHPKIMGWYHTHSRESTSMTIMDKINHLSLLDIMVSDEGGQLQGTLENMFEGKRDAGTRKSEGGGIIHDGGVALVFSPPLFIKNAPFNKYLKFYAFDDSKNENSVLLSNFKELKLCNIRTDLDSSLHFMSELAETMAGADQEPALPHRAQARKISGVAAVGNGPQKRKGAAGRGMAAAQGKTPRRKLDRECLEKYTKKEESVKKRIETIKKMISNGEDVSTLTTQLKKMKLHLDKLNRMLQRDMSTLQGSGGAEDTVLRTDCTILERKLREHNAELDKLISEMYYKVLTDLSDEGITL